MTRVCEHLVPASECRVEGCAGALPNVTAHQLRLFRAYLLTHSGKEASAAMGSGWTAAWRTLPRLYRALRVSDHLEAARVLGWLRVPELATFAEVEEIIARVHAARSAPDDRGGQATDDNPAAGASVAFSTGERDASGSEHAA